MHPMRRMSRFLLALHLPPPLLRLPAPPSLLPMHFQAPARALLRRAWKQQVQPVEI